MIPCIKGTQNLELFLLPKWQISEQTGAGDPNLGIFFFYTKDLELVTEKRNYKKVEESERKDGTFERI